MDNVFLIPSTNIYVIYYTIVVSFIHGSVITEHAVGGKASM